MAVRAIFFDIDDTLFPSTEFAELARRNSVNAMIDAGLKRNPDELYNLLLEIIGKKGSNYQEHFDELCRFLDIEKPSRFVTSAVVAYHNAKMSIQPFPGVARMLQSLREEGYRLYIASNGTTKKQWDKLIRLRIAMFFDDVFVSEEIGSGKNADFFGKILMRTSFKPEECLMVGDKEDMDIIPANKEGMITARVETGKSKKQKSMANLVLKNVIDLSTSLDGL